MRAELVLKQLRDAAAMVGELFDAGAEVVSVHIGPTNHPPTVRIADGGYAARLRPAAKLNPYSGEHFVLRSGVEIAWVEAGAPSRAARIATAIAQADRAINLKQPLPQTSRSVCDLEQVGKFSPHSSTGEVAA